MATNIPNQRNPYSSEYRFRSSKDLQNVSRIAEGITDLSKGKPAPEGFGVALKGLKESGESHIAHLFSSGKSRRLASDAHWGPTTQLVDQLIRKEIADEPELKHELSLIAFLFSSVTLYKSLFESKGAGKELRENYQKSLKRMRASLSKEQVSTRYYLKGIKACWFLINNGLNIREEGERSTASTANMKFKTGREQAFAIAEAAGKVLYSATANSDAFSLPLAPIKALVKPSKQLHSKKKKGWFHHAFRIRLRAIKTVLGGFQFQELYNDGILKKVDNDHNVALSAVMALERIFETIDTGTTSQPPTHGPLSSSEKKKPPLKNEEETEGSSEKEVLPDGTDQSTENKQPSYQTKRQVEGGSTATTSQHSEKKGSKEEGPGQIEEDDSGSGVEKDSAKPQLTPQQERPATKISHDDIGWKDVLKDKDGFYGLEHYAKYHAKKTRSSWKVRFLAAKILLRIYKHNGSNMLAKTSFEILKSQILAETNEYVSLLLGEFYRISGRRRWGQELRNSINEKISNISGAQARLRARIKMIANQQGTTSSNELTQEKKDQISNYNTEISKLDTLLPILQGYLVKNNTTTPINQGSEEKAKRV